MRLCSVEGCGRKHWATGLCNTHLARANRLGDPGPAEVREYHERGPCTVAGCDQTTEARGLCAMHYMRDRRTGSPLVVRSTSKGDAVSYAGAHSRVRDLRGRPSAYACVDCGEQAMDWAYDHGDPGEKHDERGRPYSTNPDRYRPMCRPCHGRFDTEHRRLAAAL